MMPVDYEPALVEASVLAAAGDGRAFHDQRDPLYAIADAEAREAAFVALHARWFQRRNLDRPLTEALAERPRVPAACGRGVVVRAGTAAAESADLLVAPPERPTLLVRLTPGTLAAPERALALLRHELLHVADILDPDFGYEPRLPSSGGGRVLDDRRTERYRVLWDVCIDGRLTAEGRALAGARYQRLREFTRTFPELGAAAEAVFQRSFDAARPAHRDLVALATGGEAPAVPDAPIAARGDGPATPACR
jgi:hypothetical protein